MEFKVDENLPVEVADLLRQVGYDAVTVFEQHLEGSPDSDIASVCQEEGGWNVRLICVATSHPRSSLWGCASRRATIAVT